MRVALSLSVLAVTSALVLAPALTAQAAATVEWGAVRSDWSGVEEAMVASSDSLVVSAWIDDSWSGGAFRFQVSRDHGVTWSAANAVTTDGDYPSYPAIAVDGDTIAVTWMNGADSTLRARLSTDGGASWSFPATVSSTGSEPKIAVSGTAATVAFRDGGDVESATTTDGGLNWTSAATVATPAPNHQFSAVNVTRSTTGAVVAWNDFDEDPAVWADRLMTSASVAGATWSAPSAATSPGVQDVGLFQQGAAITAVYGFEDPLTYAEELRVSRSLDGGATWVAAPLAPTTDADDVTVARNGSRITVAWVDEAANGDDVLLTVTSSDFGATWGPVRTAVSGGGAGIGSLSVIPVDAGIVLAYNVETDDGMELRVSASTDDGVTWSTPLALAVSGDGIDPYLSGWGPSAELAFVNGTGALNRLSVSVLADPSSPAGGTTPVVTGSTGTTTAATGTATLPDTGANALPFLAAGIPALLAGLGLVLLARRRGRRA